MRTTTGQVPKGIERMTSSSQVKGGISLEELGHLLPSNGFPRVGRGKGKFKYRCIY